MVEESRENPGRGPVELIAYFCFAVSAFALFVAIVGILGDVAVKSSLQVLLIAILVGQVGGILFWNPKGMTLLGARIGVVVTAVAVVIVALV